jgi:Ca2+-binding RTX toxin-like protein
VTVDLAAGTASGEGNDIIQNIGQAIGSDFNDIIVGTDGENVLIGGAGDDLIGGLDGNDTIFGGAGNDVLTGGGGQDTLDGGDGNDFFQFLDPSDGATAADGQTGQTSGDFILDFEPGLDTIQLEGLAFGFGFTGALTLNSTFFVEANFDGTSTSGGTPSGACLTSAPMEQTSRIS